MRTKSSAKKKSIGLDINYKLNWTNHVIQIMIKLQQRIDMLKHLKSKNIQSHIVMYLYKTVLRLLCMHANADWANLIKTDRKLITSRWR